MTRYYYYYERICLLAQHAESSTDHLGLLRACLDLDSRHAKTRSQSQLGQRCLTHPIDPCKGHVALLIREKRKKKKRKRKITFRCFHSETTKVFFHLKKNWVFKENGKRNRLSLGFNSSNLSLWYHLFCSKESSPLGPSAVLTDVIFGRRTYTLH